MHSFKNFISEKIEPAKGIKPKAGDEAAFMAKHTVDVMDYPGGDDDKDVTNQTKKSPAKKKRLADNDQESAEKVYEANDGECPHCDMKDGEHEKGCPMMKEAMDPVGQEDDDVDNDGDSDESDKYLKKRRKAINKAMKKEEVELDEMSDDQMKKREEIVKSMKDKTADFKKRYGDRWKAVMYATATKQAMKEEVELDEAKMKDLEIKGRSLETYAKKSGGIDKNDMMKVAAMLKRGDKSGAMKYAKKLDTDPKEYILGLMGEEADLDEATYSYKAATFNGNVVKGTGSTKGAARKDAEDKAKALGSTIRKRLPEEVELDEAYKAGNLKLKDGSQVKITSEDAKIINTLYKSLNSSNRKQMEQRMMKDKKSFSEIISFAKETVQ